MLGLDFPQRTYEKPSVSDELVREIKVGETRERTLVSVAIPVYNEEKVLPELVERLAQVADGPCSKYDFEFVFVDDGSRDGSLRVEKELIAKEPRLRVVELRRNYGQTAALQAGLDEARGDVIITMDADLQHFPEDIPPFLERIEAGCDVVCGWRKKRREGAVRRWPSRAANWMIRRISGLDIHDIGTTFRAYRREIVEDISLLGENHRFVPVFANSASRACTNVPGRRTSPGAGRVSQAMPPALTRVAPPSSLRTPGSC